MANAVTTQIITDGPRNAVVKIVGILDTSDVASTAIVDPASLGYMDNSNQQRCDQVRIDKIWCSIETGLDVQLFWDATTDVPIITLLGTEDLCFSKFGGLQNNSGTGKTGIINLVTEGWGSGIKEFTIVLHLVKQIANLRT